MKKFLLIGLDPESIDFSAPGVQAGMTAEKLLGVVSHIFPLSDASNQRHDEYAQGKTVSRAAA